MRYCLLLISLFVLKGAKAQTLQLNLSHTVNGVPMALGNASYLNAAGDTFNITAFRYYLSNFSVTDIAGNTIKAAPEYFLVSEDSLNSKRITLKLPAGRYKGLSFMIGIDSLLNCTGAQSGALDPIYGMFWTWNSGYIMAKLEGTSPSSHLPGHIIEFHIGGYRAPHITQRIVTLTLPQTLVLKSSAKINLTADAYTWFNGISFRQLAGFMTPGTAGDRIADNYQHMFSVKN